MDDLIEPYINKGVLFESFCVEDDGHIIFAIATCYALAVHTLDEHALCLALHRLKILDFVFQRDLPHHLAAFAFHFFWYLVGHCGGLGACAHRVFEGVDVAKADFLGEVAAFFERGFGLAREAYDDVSGEVEVGTKGFDALAHIAELGDGVEPVHPFQSVIGAALQADVHMGRQLFVLEKLQKVVAELVGLDGGNAHTEVAVDVQDVFYKLLEVSAFILVAPHIDSRQHDFLETVGDDFTHIIIYVLSRAARGTSSDHRDDAIRAEVVAAVVDLDEAACVEGVEGGMVAEQVAVVTFRVAVASLEVLIDDVEEGGFALVVDDIVCNAGLQQLFFPVVDHTACDDDQCLGVLASYLMDGLSAFLVAGVGDSAGVHDKDIGITIAIGKIIPRLLEARCQGIGLIEIDAAA